MKNKIIIIIIINKKNTDTHLIDKIDSGSATKRGEAISIYLEYSLFRSGRYLSLLYAPACSTSHNHNHNTYMYLIVSPFPKQEMS